jgi:hypothetical protein
MSYPPPHTSAHENDSTLETKHQQQRTHENRIQNGAGHFWSSRPSYPVEIPSSLRCLRLLLFISRASKSKNQKCAKLPFFKAFQRLSKKKFLLPSAYRDATESEYIRVTFLNSNQTSVMAFSNVRSPHLHSRPIKLSKGISKVLKVSKAFSCIVRFGSVTGPT